MNHRVKLWIAAFICSCLVTPTFSESNDDTPEAVVQSYWAAMQAGDWAKCASLIHPDSLARVRNNANGFVDSLLVLDKFGGNLRDLFGVSTKDEFEKLSDVFVFEKALQMMSLRPGFTEIIKATKHQLLGTVNERDDLIHALYRGDVRLYDSAGNQNEELININTASIGELQRLPGIGSALASRIVEHRRKHGLFKRPQDIVIVRGMSAKLYRRIAHLIRI